MKKSELKKIIKEVLQEDVKKDDVAKIYANDQWWWLVNAGDGSHLYMGLPSRFGANPNPKKIKSMGHAYHIGQLQPFSYYDDVKKWLYGKLDIDGKKYK